MIQFTLKCDQDHRFDSWFQSAAAFEKLAATGNLSCAVCGSGNVEKAMMAPRVAAGGRQSEQPAPGAGNAIADAHAKAQQDAPCTRTRGHSAPLRQPDTPAQQALAELRKHVEANSEYVGMNFAHEARRIHDGETPERAIYGEARPDEARKLIEDGVPVAPLPFVPGRKTN
ncbi:MAG: DUF1178 family protein [Pseudomonadota bacterium]|uniref:DUF1178 family protein n=1 Tax=Roseovarius TaxID=74030 RepID=UPI0022A8315B|nr:DUF1178 family protein [Roseovarius sp. EGI FJ00037]MCZ0812985.1 DUF1178 family protein [Roseovarius sp. EGI FJ00037]